MKNLFEDRRKDVQERTKVNTSYRGGSCISLRAMEGHRVVVVEVYEAQNRSKVNASSKSGTCLSLRAMGEHRGVVVKTNMAEYRGKYEFEENEKEEEAVNQPTTQLGGVQSCGGVQGCREVRGGEGMFWEPLTIARDSMIKNSMYYSDREEVLAELSRSLLSFLLPRQIKYEANK
jgi:hypothetical protein